jgi:hypothetical protein
MLIGCNRMDDGVPVKNRSRTSEDRKIINVEASVVESVNEYAEELEGRLGFQPTFSQTLKYIVNELRGRKKL